MPLATDLLPHYFRLGMVLAALASVGIHNPTALADSADNVGKGEKLTLKVDAFGFHPPELSLKSLDGSVFIFNASESSLLTLRIAFGGRTLHCASSNLKVDDNGDLVSNKPIAPKDFAIMCFPEAGRYKVEALGITQAGKPKSKDPVVGWISVGDNTNHPVGESK